MIHMLGRFTVRPSNDGDGTYGVWDGAVNGWRSQGLSAEAAEHAKTELDVQFDAHGPRSADAVRRVNPAQPVEHAEWEPGELDIWIRDGDQWLGRVRDREGRLAWIPAGDLRPATRDTT
jgi:hypothetical protein